MRYKTKNYQSVKNSVISTLIIIIHRFILSYTNSWTSTSLSFTDPQIESPFRVSQPYHFLPTVPLNLEIEDQNSLLVLPKVGLLRVSFSPPHRHFHSVDRTQTLPYLTLGTRTGASSCVPR